MAIEFLKCSHGVSKGGLIPCKKCEEDKQKNKNLFQMFLEVFKENKRKPIYRGCPNKGACYCPGTCKEIIGYQD